MLVNVKVTGGLNIEWGQIDPKVTGGLKEGSTLRYNSWRLYYPRCNTAINSIAPR